MSWWVWLIIIVIVLAIIGNNEEKKEKNNKKFSGTLKHLREKENQNEFNTTSSDIFKRKELAEDYIMNSGNFEAGRTLMLAKENPSNYSKVLADGMKKGNSTLKTALGVMTGVIAGNMISNLVTDSLSSFEIQNKLDNIQSELNTLEKEYFGVNSFNDTYFEDKDSFLDERTELYSIDPVSRV